MRRRIKITFTLMLLILCAGLMTRATLADSNSIIRGNIEYYMQTDKSVYNLGENVQMLYRVTNLGDASVMFFFAVGPVNDRCDFMVDKDGERIWDNLNRPSFDAETSFTLRPLGSRSFTWSWDMTDLSGSQILHGNYDVTGVLDYYPSHERYVPVLVQIEVIPKTVEALINIDPNTLNLQSKGKWITCYIWLPEGYDVADIDPNTIQLEEVITADWTWFDEEEQVVMVKFGRSEVQNILSVGEVELTVTGELIDGTKFEGADIIKVIDKGNKKK